MVEWNTGRNLCVTLVLSWCCLLPAVDGFAYELTFMVEAGHAECFYQPISRAGVVLDIDYQVIEGSGMDITFTLRGPNNDQIKLDQRRSMGSHQHRTQAIGDYQLCFDNKFSRMTAKMVFFEVYTDVEDDSFPSAMAEAQKSATQESAEEIMEMTVEQIKETLTSVQRHTERCRTLQSMISSFMRRDRTIAEANYTRVNLFSGGYLFAMVSVSLVQVLMIRSLFTQPGGHQMKMAT